MARYIRLYNSPTEGSPGNILGFSATLEGAAHDQELHNWLAERGYIVTPETMEQRRAKAHLGGFAIGTREYLQAPGIPIPASTVSAGHLLIEPPLRDEDL